MEAKNGPTMVAAEDQPVTRRDLVAAMLGRIRIDDDLARRCPRPHSHGLGRGRVVI
jgi:hypothetical protein